MVKSIFLFDIDLQKMVILFQKLNFMRKILFSTFILAAFLFTSCGPSLTPFTQRLYEQNGWTENDLRRIQFYLSQDIVLKRDDSGSNQSRIEQGNIRVKTEGNVEKIVIRKGTPGVLVFSPRNNRFAIGFERDDERFLMFGPNPKANDRYVLLASEWQKNGGTVTYDGKQYRVDNNAAYAALMVNLKRVRKLRVRERTATGRRVN